MEDARTITPSLELLLVSRNLERVADLATNIGEDAVFLAEGKTSTLFVLDKNGDTTPCSDDDSTLCAAGGRFRVRVTWRTGQGLTGPGHAVKLNANSGAFWFFSADNTEMLVKVLDACTPPFNSFWVFYAATTNVGFSVEVTDTRSGLVKTYSNPYGLAAPSINDTGTFATCR